MIIKPQLTGKRIALLLAITCLTLGMTACGYPSPAGGGGLTPFIVVVTPTPLPTVTLTPNASTTLAASNPTLPAGTTGPAVASTTKPPAPLPATATPGANPPTYTVKSGDTLLAIARRFGVDAADLIKLNDLTDADNLKIDQVLKIPARKSAAPTTKP